VATPYHIKIAPIAAQQIKQLPAKHQKIVIKLAEALSVNPRPPGANKIHGMTGLYSETVYPLRLVYKIDDQDILLLVVKTT
jgi:mRNA-degrading endonuclease RelE of RelBE toxin-antitoxin system